MSYQIKSTPYFRRMFNNSKKNGQLQRLREEYERIQEFNDRTIELKMRQVRLKRLFREIEEIKEGGGGGGGSGGNNSSSVAANAINRATPGAVGGGSPSPSSVSHSGRRRHQQHPHQQSLLSASITPEQRRHHQRAEALIRSRELGKELSRRNAQMTEAGVVGYLRPDHRNSAQMRAVADFRRDAQDRRERAAKRISYGNDQSRQNLQRQLKVCQRRLSAKYQSHQNRELGSNEFRSDYRHLTPSQLDMMVDEEDLVAEQQRYFREQEEDELQLAEERYRQQEKRLRLEAVGSSSTSEEEDGQEELRFLRGEQTLSEPEDEDQDEEVNVEKLMELRRRHNHKRQAEERFLGDHNYNLTLAEEHFRLEAHYTDEGRQDYQEKDEDEGVEAEGETSQLVDEKEAEEQRRRRLREKISLLPLDRFSFSSTTIGPASSARIQQYKANQPLPRALSSDQEMLTAPLATEDVMTTKVSHRSIQCRTASEADNVPALNNWRRVSLMMPWFKAFSPSKSLSECSRSLGGSIKELQLRDRDTAETPAPSMVEENSP